MTAFDRKSILGIFAKQPIRGQAGSQRTTSTHSMHEIAIPLSKRKIALLIVVGLTFTAGGIFIFFIGRDRTGFDSIHLMGMGIACVCVFGLATAYGIRKLVDSRPGLIIDADGLQDNSSAVSAGRIPWEDIVGFRTVEVSGHRFIAIELTDAQKYINRSGLFRRWLNSSNASFVGTPINISSSVLDVDFDELVYILTNALDQHKAVANENRATKRRPRR